MKTMYKGNTSGIFVILTLIEISYVKLEQVFNKGEKESCINTRFQLLSYTYILHYSVIIVIINHCFFLTLVFFGEALVSQQN